MANKTAFSYWYTCRYLIVNTIANSTSRCRCGVTLAHMNECMYVAAIHLSSDQAVNGVGQFKVLDKLFLRPLMATVPTNVFGLDCVQEATTDSS